MMRVLLLSNHLKPQVTEALKTFRPWLADRARIVEDRDVFDPQLASTQVEADAAIMLGGDGTLLGLARRIVHLKLPLIGVNFGKLGFLAPFSLDEVIEQWDALAAGRNPVSERVMLEATVHDPGQAEPTFFSPAMNDCVVTAGPPYRMIDLELLINADHNDSYGAHFGGDGVIVATPGGSTAYNVSAGGPIIAPDVDALVITPICPHSLAFRPIVVGADDVVTIRLHNTNPGTTLVLDGQVPVPVRAGGVLTVRTHPTRLRLVTNPRNVYWRTLATKMHWAARPRQL